MVGFSRATNFAASAWKLVWNGPLATFPGAVETGLDPRVFWHQPCVEMAKITRASGFDPF
jgi:hypothetical protein